MAEIPSAGDPLIPPDEQDAKLSASGINSIFQSIRVLTPAQRRILDELLAGTRKAVDGRTMRAIQNKIPDIMDRLGLTDEYLINNCLKPLLDAEETKFFKLSDKVVTVNEQGEVVDASSVLVESPARPALGIRRDALDMAFRLRGSYARPDENEGSDSHDINVNIIQVGA